MSPAHTYALRVVRSINLGTTAVNVSTTPGWLRGFYLFNATAGIIYVKVYNKANATEADTPILTLPIPGTTGSTGAGATQLAEASLRFDTAISIRATTGVADNNTDAPAANGCIANIFFSNHAQLTT